MGLLSSLFSSKVDYPPVDPGSPAAGCLEELRGELEELAGKVSQRLEVVPSDHGAFVFIGKPPKDFGLAWVHDGQVSGLNKLVQDQGMKTADIERVVQELRVAYEHAEEAPRFTTTLNNRPVVVTPSGRLESEVHEIIDRITH